MWQSKIYTFKDIQEKRSYIFDRVKKIYEQISDDDINNLLDDIKIRLREQKEKGASNHSLKEIYVSFKELEKYDISNEKSFLKYLNSPVSSITHETTHIFQNIFKIFPHIQYTFKDDNGNTKVNYEKYVNDAGEKQARIEQILELLKWGFEKEEIVGFLFSRFYKDKNLWRNLIDTAVEANKIASNNGEESLMYVSDQGKQTTFDRSKKTRGNNYERSY